LRALFTAENKLGVRELNRPEDVEWNPADKRLYVAFTNNGSKVAVDQNGVLYDAATHSTTSPTRDDQYGALFVLEEANDDNPGSSLAFSFYSVWQGTSGEGLLNAANPDNIMIDPVGNVFFGTDGNFGRNGTADAIYYLDREQGRAIRIVAVPSDAEASGPALTPDGKTLFISVQHPGESVYSTWPSDSKYGPLSSIIAITVAP
jgi:secreted PhoX family phosphatase